ncbi:MAG: prepilin peptidase [Oscillospiraceae bacterium]|nr:prepilin peptidase [Oscillospiraceae bacterium]
MTIRVGGAFLAYCLTVAALLGAVSGSFLTCAAGRIVAGRSFLTGRSRCDACGHTLGVRDLVPVLSWLLLRGRCRYCGAKVPTRCLWTELLCAAMAALCLLRFDLTVLCLRNWLFLCCLLLLSLVDWDSFEIPDGCHVFSIVVWVAAAPFLGWLWRDAAMHVLCAFACGGALLGISLALDKLLGRDSLGGGDIKLFFVVGLYLGFVGTLFAVILACVLGLLLTVLRRAARGESVPFGPAISAAAAVMLLYGDALTGWYLTLLGL